MLVKKELDAPSSAFVMCLHGFLSFQPLQSQTPSFCPSCLFEVDVAFTLQQIFRQINVRKLSHGRDMDQLSPVTWQHVISYSVFALDKAHPAHESHSAGHGLQ